MQETQDSILRQIVLCIPVMYYEQFILHFFLYTVQCEPTGMEELSLICVLWNLKYQRIHEYMKIHDDNRTLPLCQWEPFQFECTLINIIAESCAGLYRHMILDCVSVQASSKKEAI